MVFFTWVSATGDGSEGVGEEAGGDCRSPWVWIIATSSIVTFVPLVRGWRRTKSGVNIIGHVTQEQPLCVSDFEITIVGNGFCWPQPCSIDGQVILHSVAVCFVKRRKEYPIVIWVQLRAPLVIFVNTTWRPSWAWRAASTACCYYSVFYAIVSQDGSSVSTTPWRRLLQWLKQPYGWGIPGNTVVQVGWLASLRHTINLQPGTKICILTNIHWLIRGPEVLPRNRDYIIISHYPACP